MKNIRYLFTDGSVNTATKEGFGSFISVSENDFNNKSVPEVQIRRFENTTSTKLEIQTLLWALSEVGNHVGEIVVFTDSQNIIGLPGRRKRLERYGYLSKEGKEIKNANLYKQFFQFTDNLDCRFVKLNGHKKKSEKDFIDSLFTIVDRASRRALRYEY